MSRRLSGSGRIGHVSIQIRFLLGALPAAHFELNAAKPASDLVH